MHLISRRSVMWGTASVAISVTVPAAAATSDKRSFMTIAIADIEENAERIPRPPKDQGFVVQRWGNICIPVPFADFDFYYTDGALNWHPNADQKLPPVSVPHGFCTDLTSIPQAFWSALPKTGKYAYAAIVHDYLYWTQTTTRLVADDILYGAMQDSGVGAVTLNSIYGVVRSKFGEAAWDGNKKAKSGNKQKRFLRLYPPRDRLVTWTEWSSDQSRFQD